MIKLSSIFSIVCENDIINSIIKIKKALEQTQ